MVDIHGAFFCNMLEAFREVSVFETSNTIMEMVQSRRENLNAKTSVLLEEVEAGAICWRGSFRKAWGCESR
ncbi:MAG: hypothetical protein DRJ03_27995 [Chloroflexi bacterium]|nr:MAG: hypothetical protein DRJ03_27995 [Chloroflexota bacterium]